MHLFNPFKALLEFVSAPVTKWIEGRNKINELQEGRRTQVVVGTQTWEEQQAENAKDSWKDEYLTVILSMPFVSSFCSAWYDALSNGLSATVANQEAIDAVTTLPTEYWYLFSTALAASFGIKGIPKAVAKIRAGKAKLFAKSEPTKQDTPEKGTE